MRAVDTNPDGTTHTFMPSCVVSRQLSDICNLTVNSQQDSDTQTASHTKFSYTSIITKPSCQGVDIAGKLNDGIRPTPSKENHDSAQREITCHHTDNNHEQNQGIYTGKDISSVYGEMATSDQECFLIPEEQVTKCPQYAVVVIVPSSPRKQTVVTRSMTKTVNACKRPPQHKHTSDYSNTNRSPVLLATQSDKKQRYQKKRHSSADGPVLCQTSLSLGCSSGNQDILGRAILTIHSDGSKPAYFFTFMPDTMPAPSS